MCYLHDTHLHLDLYNKQMPQIVKEIEENHIFTIAVTNLPVLFEKLKKTINSRYIHLALGFHPELFTEYGKYIGQMWSYINDTRFIGEVGLDFKNVSRDTHRIQSNFFDELLRRCDFLGNKILSVHSKGSEDEVLSYLPNNFNSKVIFHWYSGTFKNLDIALKKGCYFSINYQMLASNKGQDIINRIPEDKLLLESDAPFIRIQNRVFRPSDLKITLLKLAGLKKLEPDELKKSLSMNLNKLLS